MREYGGKRKDMEATDTYNEVELLICGFFNGFQSERANRGGQANYHQHRGWSRG